MEWSDSFKEKIKITVDAINILFTESNIINSVITLDFTFFFPKDILKNEGLSDIIIYQYAPMEYVNFLNILYGENDNQFAKFADKTKVVADLSCDNSKIYSVLDFQPPLEYCNQPLDETDFTAPAWHADLNKAKFGGASIVVSREYINQKYKYEIQAGVYLILKNQFGSFPDDTYELKNNSEITIDEIEGNENIKKVVKKIWILLENLLFDEMFEILTSKFKGIEFEKEQLNREKMLYVGMGHYIKNSTLGLEAHENEIIQYLKSLKNTNDKILVTAQLQKLIYSLIRLYLQIRQISGSGVIDTKATNTKVQINLYNLINLIYLHTIITRGKFYIALGNPSNLDAIKAVVIHQNEIIGKLTDLLQNQTFEQSDIDAILEKSEEINLFHSLSKSGYEILIKIDPKLKMNVELNSIQFKYLYTVFAEIFDNCFSSKHSSGSRIAYLYLGNESQDYNTIIISSRDSSKDIETIFEFDENEMCSDCDSTGNGIKIIQSALANEYLSSALMIPRDSKSKSFTMSNGGEISVFEYKIKLNKNLFV